MKRRSRQRGVALLALIAVLVIGGTWYLVSRLQELSANRTALERAKNAKVLNRAKQALIGYVIAQANHAGENNPGALPCPEAGASFNSTTGTDGKMASSCALPAVGRFPWRTIGTEKLVDAAGEPLWYVISPGWASTGSNTVINSNTAGQLTIDGVAPATLATADTVIALIIAPGRAFSVPTATGCVARSQTRPQTSGVAPDVRDYLECDNSNGDSSFVTTGPSGSFNDQVLKVTVGDLMPGLEAAVYDRVQRTGEFFDTMKTVYAAGTWGVTGNPMYPFAAAFSDPSTSAMQGAAATYAGLLPVNYAETSPGSGTLCTAGASAPRCSPTFVNWSTAGITVSATGGTASIASYNCGASTSSLLSCSITYDRTCLAGNNTTVCSASINVNINATANNLGMAMRKVSANLSTLVSANLTSPTLSASLNTTGTGSATLGGALPTVSCTTTNGPFFGIYWCTATNTVTVTAPPHVFADHPILGTTTSNGYEWFVRNKWHEVTYYAVAANQTPAGLPGPSCTSGGTCLTVTNPPTSGGAAGAQRAIAILMGRSINGNTRPSATLGDYLEYGNVGASYENQNVRDSVRNVLTDTGVADAYSVSLSAVSVGKPIYFRAANSNTGASTLTTAATGMKSLLNSDLTPLSASQIRANNAVLVTWDGTQFVLATKRPFNDRVLVIDHN